MAITRHQHPTAGTDWNHRLVLVAAGLIFWFVVIEWALRTAGPAALQRYPLPLQFGSAHRYLERHPIYGVFHIPNTAAWVWSSEFITRVEINSRGLREREIGYEKPPGVTRIVVLGDSFVEASQVMADQTFARRLEALLNGAGERTVQVLNAGVSGYSTAQEYLLITREVLRYEPDIIVLVVYPDNDIGSNNVRIRGNTHVPYFAVTEDGDLRLLPVEFAPRTDWGPIDTLFRESMVVSRLHTNLHNWWFRFEGEATPDGVRFAKVARGVYADPPDEVWDEAWRITEMALVRIREATGGAALLLVNAPASFEIHPEDWDRTREALGLPAASWSLDRPSERLGEIATRRAIPFLDLRPALRTSAPRAGRLYYLHDRHWNPAGHEVVARTLADALSRWSMRAPA